MNAPHPRRRRRALLMPVLPTLLTAGNLACGITAILCAASSHKLLLEGSILVFAAMVCDMLDGKVARLTGSEGEFGAELDSLADVVSFGVAPAMLVHRLVLGDNPTKVWAEGEKLVWLIAVFYAVMTAVRLARYNVQHSDEEATRSFKGLPSPGAAAFLCSWVLLYAWYVQAGRFDGSVFEMMTLDQPTLDYLLRFGLTCATPVMAVLMVSAIPFPHFGNTLLSGRIRLRRLLLILLAIGALVLYPILALVVATSAYVIVALGRGLPEVVSRWRAGRDLLEEDEDDEHGDGERAGAG